MTCSVPSIPCSRDAGARAASGTEKRTYSAVLTGSISRRSARASGGGCARARGGCTTPRRRRAAEAAAQHLAFGFEPDQRDLDRARVDSAKRAPVRDGDRAARLEPAAQDLGERASRVAGTAARATAAISARSSRPDRRRARAPAARHVQNWQPAGGQRRRAVLRDQLVEPRRSTPRPAADDQRVAARRAARRRRARPATTDSATSPIAAGSRMPTPPSPSPRVVRRSVTARVRRSSSGASSRYAYGLALRISWQNGRRLGRVDRDGANRAALDRAQDVESTVEIHRFVQAVVDRLAHQDVIGMRIGPVRFSAQAAASGKHDASRSSARMRRICGGTLRPPRSAGSRARASRSSASARRTSARAAALASACARRSPT
jgi:hypothetical protein